MRINLYMGSNSYSQASLGSASLESASLASVSLVNDDYLQEILESAN
jgi:hypothetical protein